MDRLLDLRQVLMVGVVHAELIRGFITRSQPQSMRADLELIPYLESTHETWRLTGQILADLQMKGQTIPFPDAVIAAQGVEYNLPVFTLDRHFSRVEGLEIYEIN
jgi:predicted nucleic acid-binding protein